MKSYSLKAAATVATLIGGLAFAGTANATLTVVSVNGGAPTGVTLDNLDWLPVNGDGSPNQLGGSHNCPGPACLTVSFSPDGGAVQGAASGLYAPPNLTNNNGAGFGNPGDGPDTTTYVTAGGQQSSSATFLLPGDELYFGLLWGSVDDFNVLTFYKDGNPVGVVNVADVTALANGDQGPGGTYYVNITSDVAFNRVVATSGTHAFEIDNIAFNPTIPTGAPEPITLSLFGAGLAGLGLARRRRKA